MEIANTAEHSGKGLPQPAWKRLGFAGFIFFLAKRLLWLAAPAILYVFT